jgi:hypothetical protein
MDHSHGYNGHDDLPLTRARFHHLQRPEHTYPAKNQSQGETATRQTNSMMFHLYSTPATTHREEDARLLQHARNTDLHGSHVPARGYRKKMVGQTFGGLTCNHRISSRVLRSG